MPNRLCSFIRPARPSANTALLVTGIHAKKACQLSMPKASTDAAMSAAAVALAATMTRQRWSNARITGNSSPNCGL